MEEPTPVMWVDDGTTWDNPECVLSDGPQSVILEPDEVQRLLHKMQRPSGRVGFTVEPGPRN